MCTHARSGLSPLLLALLFIVAGAAVLAGRPSFASADFREFDARAALDYSQAALRRTLSDHEFLDTEGRTVRLSDFEGQPVLINMVYSACDHTCTISTKHLSRIAQIARNALGQDSFTILTIGFDTARDNPETMRLYARQQGMSNAANWKFLSTDQATIDALSAEMGFIYYATPRGFDHMAKVTVLDQDRVVYRHVYGEVFETPLLVEPLKELVFDARRAESPFEALGARVRLFCTTYDAAADRYYFDYSLFVGMGVGLTVILSTLWFLIHEFRRRPRKRRLA
ncbi:hypothetical protein B1C78_07030 [Thioalkalivibrio denitrificans]|uniref:SCO family protein n=1 Tax=Thioalkalivibrio denitrificans TaxID=108003 RepID=A0A1V3NKF6_9GAMM|nr:SCO family protein [Thioalkalivibrio denitrificans]OOG25236.1 hypothetical protein B1C78_07030 [Thioalkalivibrio denitrificans]